MFFNIHQVLIHLSELIEWFLDFGVLWICTGEKFLKYHIYYKTAVYPYIWLATKYTNTDDKNDFILSWTIMSSRFFTPPTTGAWESQAEMPLQVRRPFSYLIWLFEFFNSSLQLSNCLFLELKLNLHISFCFSFTSLNIFSMTKILILICEYNLPNLTKFGYLFTLFATSLSSCLICISIGLFFGSNLLAFPFLCHF